MDDELNSKTFTDFGFYDVSTNNVNASPIKYGPYEKSVISDWKQCGIHHNIMQAFNKMNIREMTSIQKYSFSYLMNNYNTAIVGASKGKSISYLVKIMSSMMNSNDKIKSVSPGPNTIILTNSLESCYNLENLSKSLLSSAQTDKINVVVVDPFIPSFILETSITCGCDILISTPSNLINLLNTIESFCWLNLRHFVFDNIDILLDNYNYEIAAVLEIFSNLAFSLPNVQFISTSIKWTKDVDSFLSLLFNKWQYVFGCHLEAARYLKTQFYVVNLKNNKLKMISWYLKNNFTHGRGVLITSDSYELNDIYDHIQTFNSDIDIILANQSKDDSTRIKWNDTLEKTQRLLICSDDIEFNNFIDNANYLLHYDIPVKKFKFEERFSFLQDSGNMLTKNKRSSYVFVSETTKDMSMMPKIIEIMQHFCDVHPSLLQLAKEEINYQEKKKKNIFCSKIQQFGKCPNQLLCDSRHIVIKEHDKPADNIPKSGLVELEILYVYNASHMFAKLLKLNSTENLSDTENWSNFDDNSDIITYELSVFYSNPKSRIILLNFKPGDKVAVELETKIKNDICSRYFRAIVIDIIEENTISSKVQVKLLDEGSVEIVSKCKVFLLPDHLEKLPTVTVDVFLLSVKPTHFDNIWYSRADLDVKKKIMSVKSVIVNVELSLGNTIWISKMHSKHFSSTLKKFEIETILPDLLLNNNYADSNPTHLSKLEELVVLAGFDHIVLSKKKDQENNVTVEWAYLDENISEVEIDYFISLDCFFVRDTKNRDRFNDLQEHINKYVNQKEAVVLKKFAKGEICLAWRKDKKLYGRIEIFKVPNATHVVAFFVDFGDFFTINNNLLITIHPYLITLLPFQAIECSLSGINDFRPSGLDLVDCKFKLTRGQLHCEVMNVVSPAKFTSGCHYQVILYGKNRNINSTILEVYNECISDFYFSD